MKRDRNGYYFGAKLESSFPACGTEVNDHETLKLGLVCLLGLSHFSPPSVFSFALKSCTLGILLILCLKWRMLRFPKDHRQTFSSRCFVYASRPPYVFLNNHTSCFWWRHFWVMPAQRHVGIRCITPGD